MVAAAANPGATRSQVVVQDLASTICFPSSRWMIIVLLSVIMLGGRLYVRALVVRVVGGEMETRRRSRKRGASSGSRLLGKIDFEGALWLFTFQHRAKSRGCRCRSAMACPQAIRSSG